MKKNHKYPDNGKVEYFYDNGTIELEGERQAGNHIGIWTWWYENGQKQREGQCLDQGSCIGKWTYWHENGQKEKEGNFKENTAIDGYWTYWDKNGLKIKDVLYNNGMKSFCEISYYYENGNIKSKGAKAYFKQGINSIGSMKETGKWIYFYKNGQKEKECHYNHKLPGILNYHGSYMEWYENGKKASEIEYWYNKKIFREIHWNDDGSVIRDVNHGNYFTILKKIF